MLFVDLLFALVVVELLDPMRNPERIAAEGWWQIGLTFALTVLSWIGYHLSLSRADEPIHVDAPPFVHLVLDVLMVAAYWLCAVSFERVNAPLSWWFIPNPSAVPEAFFVALAFLLYVAWDWTAHWIHGPWAKSVDARISGGVRTPYGESIRVWNGDDVGKWRRRTAPTHVCFALSLIVLVLAIVVQEGSDTDIAPRSWVVGLDIALIAIVVGFRTGKEAVSYPTTVNKTLTACCAIAFVGALAVPAVL